MSLFGKFLGVGGATSASRVLGFVREAMIASVLGAGPVADAFYAALRFPNLFRRLFAEGAFNSAFVPIFAKEVESNGKDSAARFAGEVFSVLALRWGHKGAETSPIFARSSSDIPMYSRRCNGPTRSRR